MVKYSDKGILIVEAPTAPISDEVLRANLVQIISQTPEHLRKAFDIDFFCEGFKSGYFSTHIKKMAQHLVPLENIVVSHDHFEAVRLLGEGVPSDIVLFDQSAFGMIREYVPNTVGLYSKDPTFLELEIDVIAESENLPIEGKSRQLRDALNIYQGKKEDFRALLIALHPFQYGIELITPIARDVSPYMAVFYAEEGTRMCPDKMIAAIDSALGDPDFITKRAERREQAKQEDIERDKRTVLELVKRMASIPETDPRKGNFPAFIVGYTPPRAGFEDELELVKNSPSLMIDLNTPSKGFDLMLYLRQGLPIKSIGDIRHTELVREDYRAVLQLPGNPKKGIEQVIPGIMVKRYDQPPIKLMWIDELNQWIGHSFTRNEGGSVDRDTFSLDISLEDFLLKSYGVNREKVGRKAVSRLSPSELTRISRNLVPNRYREMIMDLLHKTGFSEDVSIRWFERNIEGISPDDYDIARGFTGLGVLINMEWVIKFDEMPRIGYEYMVYTNLKGLDPFIPKAKGFSESDDGKFGALILENPYIRTVSGFDVAKDHAARNGLALNENSDILLYIMGLFHSIASSDPSLKNNLGLVKYEDTRGIVHAVAGNIPQDDISDKTYERFKETEIPVNRILGPINMYNAMLRYEHESGNLSVIHGDFKPENIVNGCLIDFSMFGMAFEVDELAYFFSDHRIKSNLAVFHGFIDQYIDFRSSHDPAFHKKSKDGGRDFMHSLADTAFLRQLVLRHSVMKKRDLMDPDKYQQRQYYQHRINEVLREGRFV